MATIRTMGIWITIVALGAMLASGTAAPKDDKAPRHEAVTAPHDVPSRAPQPTPEVNYAQPAKGQKIPWRFFEPEWFTVYVTLAYVVIAYFTLRAVKQQARTMAEQAKDFRDSANSSSRTEREILIAVRVQAEHLAAQVEEMKAQTVVAQTSANAALLNAQAVINAERALLLFTWKKERLPGLEGPFIFHINVVNCGKVPARRLYVNRSSVSVMLMDDFLEEQPDYPDDLDGTREWLAPKESWRVATFAPYGERHKRVLAAQRSSTTPDDIEVIIYGQVTYNDGISPSERRSRFCFAHDRRQFSTIGGSLVPVGTEVHLECT
jgi:hypothetical protein